MVPGTEVLLCSTGRRPYLVEWFVNAAARTGLPTPILVADCDEYSASRSSGNEFILAPRVSEPSYVGWLAHLLDTRDIGLALSVNDHELSVWAHSPLLSEYAHTRLLRLTAPVQASVEDKMRMAELLPRFGVRTPQTWLASEPRLSAARHAPSAELIVKHRFGSGSVGLQRTTARDLESTITACLPGTLSRTGDAISRDAARDDLVVQEVVLGVEYGLDVVCDFEGRFVAAFAREKHAMRNGETDKAITVDPRAFDDLARTLARAVPHNGLIDVDVIVDDNGDPWVIDINPRFGGGYPFSHLAGADVPGAYLAWMRGTTPLPGWLEPTAGVRGAKSVSTSRVDPGAL